MSENIQPPSKDNQIIDDLAKDLNSEELPKFKDKDLISNLKDKRFFKQQFCNLNHYSFPTSILYIFKKRINY